MIHIISNRYRWPKIAMLAGREVWVIQISLEWLTSPKILLLTLCGTFKQVILFVCSDFFICRMWLRIIIVPLLEILANCKICQILKYKCRVHCTAQINNSKHHLSQTAFTRPAPLIFHSQLFKYLIILYHHPQRVRRKVNRSIFSPRI